MKLKRLELENFRQFVGTQQLSFAQGKEKNVTVVHGENGAGKTTLLNAFTWLFYDEVEFEQPENIVTKRALSEVDVGDRVQSRVKLEFAHEDGQYTAERIQEFQKQSTADLSGRKTDEIVSLGHIDADGNYRERQNPNAALTQILPQRLRKIFFFDGETISEMTADGGQERVQSAIRNIMGLEILERAIRHLGAVERRFEDTMQEFGSNKLSELVSKKGELEDQIEELETDHKNLEESRSETEKELREKSSRLAELADSADLQKRRDRIKEEKAELSDDIDGVNDRLGSVLSDSGHLPFAMPAVESTARMLQDKRRKGEIPSEIKTQFVEDLLEVEECICGRPLGHDSPAREEVSQWRNRAGSSDLEEAAMNIVTRLSEIGKGQQKLYNDLGDQMGERSDKRNRKKQINEELDEISAKLSDIETEDIASLENERKEFREKVSELNKNMGAVRSEIERLEEELDSLSDEVDEAREENETANTARRRAQTTAYLATQIETLFSRFQDDVRESVNDRVNEIFRSIIEAQYYARISENYELRILKDVGDTEGEDVAKSTGERQVASLSFIASLVSLAKDRYESGEEATYFSGGIYPMLMDSPFGSLDPIYQERVSQTLPQMGEQVIVLVTESQWSEAVAGKMEAIAGQQYELEYYDGHDHDYTEIVRHGGVA